ncbi:S-adenosyl-L-methionine-dependent methyltransferase [Mycena galopus ATCC 62051]|nr:S-adenosyl-L-methionine-dependent methyltransferase [Mycena galopus ATCC 62051]
MDEASIKKTYQLPTDKEERERLDLQHRMWSIMFNGLNPPELHDEINARMVVTEGLPPSVLDVGSGSGSWAIEMGNIYLQARILGVDLVIDSRPQVQVPPNVHFKQLDITQGFPSIDGGYDIIQARVVTGHLKDPESFVQAAYAELKPGGLMILADAWKPFWADKSTPIPLFPGVHDPENVPPSGSWWAGWSNFWFRTGYIHCRPVESLINGQHGLSLVYHERYLVPLHQCNDDKEREGLGAISNKNILRFCHATVDSFLATGQFTRPQVEEWIKLIEKEFETKPIYLAWDIACGVKPS